MAEPDPKRPRVGDDGPVLKFRNYTPTTEEFKGQVLPKAEAEHIEKELQEKIEPVTALASHSVDLLNLAPRKVDWDLKRDVSKKLEKLERRTKRAMADMLRKRLAGESAAAE